MPARQRIRTRVWYSKSGHRRIRLYSVWRGMKDRCLLPSCDAYRNYGGRGIKICDEWMDFDAFRSWAIVSGYQKDLQIDRIDNDGNYCPENCHFTTAKRQAENRRDRLYASGQDHHMARLTEREARYIKTSDERGIDLAIRFGVSASAVSDIRSGRSWSHI